MYEHLVHPDPGICVWGGYVVVFRGDQLIGPLSDNLE